MSSQIHGPSCFTPREIADGRLRLKCDGTCAETKFYLSAKRTSPFKLVAASVQSTTRSRGVCISDSNAAYTMFRGSVKSTGYPLHLPVSPSLPLPCVTVCHHISIGLYPFKSWLSWPKKSCGHFGEENSLFSLLAIKPQSFGCPSLWPGYNID